MTRLSAWPPELLSEIMVIQSSLLIGDAITDLRKCTADSVSLAKNTRADRGMAKLTRVDRM